LQIVWKQLQALKISCPYPGASYTCFLTASATPKGLQSFLQSQISAVYNDIQLNQSIFSFLTLFCAADSVLHVVYLNTKSLTLGYTFTSKMLLKTSYCIIPLINPIPQAPNKAAKQPHSIIKPPSCGFLMSILLSTKRCPAFLASLA